MQKKNQHSHKVAFFSHLKGCSVLICSLLPLKCRTENSSLVSLFWAVGMCAQHGHLAVHNVGKLVRLINKGMNKGCFFQPSTVRVTEKIIVKNLYSRT